MGLVLSLFLHVLFERVVRFVAKLGFVVQKLKSIAAGGFF